MEYCWQVYQKSDCEVCPYYIGYQNGSLNLDDAKEIIVVED